MRLLVIARHGNTFEEGEPARRIGRRTDLPLVEAGRAQARRLAEEARRCNWRFDRILTGSLSRTRESAAEFIAHGGGTIQVEVADWLDEVDHGPDEDQPEHLVIDRIGYAALASWETEGIAPPGWDVSATERLQAWRAMLQAPRPHRTMIFTSSGSARFALLSLPEKERPASLKLRTGSYGVLLKRGGAWRCLIWNAQPNQ